jgi:hypothetical protein
MRRLEAHWGVKITDTPRGNPVDGIVYLNGILYAAVEYKARDMPNFYHYPYILLSARKYQILKAKAREWKVKALFMVETNDGTIHIVDLTNTNLKIHTGNGRTAKTRDAWDVEPCVHIPRIYFERVR